MENRRETEKIGVKWGKDRREARGRKAVIRREKDGGRKRRGRILHLDIHFMATQSVTK